MNDKKLIKNINRKWIIGYFLFHVILFALFAAIIAPTFNGIEEILTKLKSPSGLLPLLSFPFSIVLEGIIPSDYKAILVFWRLKNPLPGSRAFSEIAQKDSKIDPEKLLAIFPDGLPEEEKDQNREWFKLFRKFSEKPIVYATHRHFLLTRDLTAITVVLIPFCLFGHIFWKTPWRRVPAVIAG